MALQAIKEQPGPLVLQEKQVTLVIMEIVLVLALLEE